jgi:hypothetical protein
MNRSRRRIAAPDVSSRVWGRRSRWVEVRSSTCTETSRLLPDPEPPTYVGAPWCHRLRPDQFVPFAAPRTTFSVILGWRIFLSSLGVVNRGSIRLGFGAAVQVVVDDPGFATPVLGHSGHVRAKYRHHVSPQCQSASERTPNATTLLRDAITRSWGSELNAISKAICILYIALWIDPFRKSDIPKLTFGSANWSFANGPSTV